MVIRRRVHFVPVFFLKNPNAPESMKNSELNYKHRNDEFTVISFRNLLKSKCQVSLVVKYILTLDVTGCNLHGRVFLMIRCKDSVFS